MPMNPEPYLLELQNIVSHSPTHELPIKILQFIKNFSTANNISYMVYNDTNGLLEYRIGIPSSLEFRKVLSLDKGITGYCARNLKQIYVKDVINDSQFKNIYLKIDPKVRSEFAIPLILGNRLFGVLDLESHNIDGFSSDIIKVVKLMSIQALIALQNCENVLQ